MHNFFITATKFDCNFDDSIKPFCGWNNDATADFRWTRHYGKTIIYPTGPTNDHSTTGSYIYLEAPGRKPQDVARIETDIIESPKDCMSFWFHMYGYRIGILSVYVQFVNSIRDMIWSIGGNNGDKWHSKTIYLWRYIQTKNKFKVGFQGTRGNGFLGDIALDDISFHSCPERPRKSTYNCTFDDWLCGWSHDTSNQLHWTRKNGTISKSGVSKEISTTYMNMDTSFRNLGDLAVITTPPMNLAEQCLTFWYHMDSANVGSLRVRVSTRFHKNVVVWSTSGNHGNRWQNVTINLISYIAGDRGYTVSFEGQVGSALTGNIAVDDVTFHMCEEVPSWVAQAYKECTYNGHLCCKMPGYMDVSYKFLCCQEVIYNPQFQGCCPFSDSVYSIYPLGDDGLSCCYGQRVNLTGKYCCDYQQDVLDYTNCTEKGDGFHTNGCYCSRYDECKNGQMTTKSCPLGKIFNGDEDKPGCVPVQHELGPPTCRLRLYKGDLVIHAEYNVTLIVTYRDQNWQQKTVVKITSIVPNHSLHSILALMRHYHPTKFSFKTKVDPLGSKYLTCVNKVCLVKGVKALINADGKLIQGIEMYRPEHDAIIEIDMRPGRDDLP